MTKKIDAVLDRVKEPESGLSVAELGLVERLRYNDKEKKFYVFTKPVDSPPGCCLIIAKLLQGSLAKNPTAEFQGEFPGFSIDFL